MQKYIIQISVNGKTFYGKPLAYNLALKVIADINSESVAVKAKLIRI